jgi:hypothetical protein
MANEIQVETPVEKVHNYQPTDDEGRPIGGKQVIKYTTQDELVQKLEQQTVLLIRKLRQETKKNRLGIVEDEVISDDAQRFDGPIEFNPVELSEDQRYDISRRLLDPTTASDATSELVEARLGAPLDLIGKTLRDMQQKTINLQAKIEAGAFIADNPDYYRCNENFEAIAAWISRYGLAPVKANFQKAYDTLKAQGILINGAAPDPVIIPVVEPIVDDQPLREEIPVENQVPVEVAPAPPVHRIPSGLTRENASDTGQTVKPASDIVFEFTQNGQKTVLTGLAAVSAMPSEEYKRRLLTDRTFAKKVEQLEADAKKPRR